MGLIIYVLCVGAVLGAMIQVVLFLRRRHRNAQTTLIAFTGTQQQWEDQRYAKDDKFDAISVKLVQEAHLWARRGLRIACELLESGAIDRPTYERACEVFEKCQEENERWLVVPSRLPFMLIRDTGEDARKARAQWRQLGHDRRLLRRYTTRTYWIAYNDPETVGF